MNSPEINKLIYMILVTIKGHEIWNLENINEAQ
jgi:hypothetical protein